MFKPLNTKSKILIGIVLLGIAVGLEIALFPITQSFLDYPYRRAKVSRIAITLMGLLLASIAYRHRTKLGQTLKTYFTSPDHPLNLAVFRIVLFGYLFKHFEKERILWFSQLPKELIFPPFGSEWLINIVPINQETVLLCSNFYLFFCFCAMIGLFTRTSIIAWSILGIYLIGIPQFFGKVDHGYHHLIWFGMVLGFSRSGDYLSIDAIFAAWKRAAKGIIAPPQASIVYGLPIRLIWVLFGILYFFPGFFKVWDAGFDWIIGENMKHQLHDQWLQKPHLVPIFRLDQHPLLYRLAGFGVVAFEMSFIVLIFTRFRMLAAIGGVMFHKGTDLFMQIAFAALQICYVVFFNWAAIFQKIGAFIFRQQGYLLYDGNCKLCRMTMATLRVFDIFNRIKFINALDKEEVAANNLNHLDQQALMKDMHYVIGQKVFVGFYAYRAMGVRLPILWVLLPLLYLWPVPVFGRAIYRRVADSRTCQISYGPPKKAVQSKESKASLIPVIVVGTVLIIGNLYCGVTGTTQGWPFSCYPKFNSLAGEYVPGLQMEMLDENNQKVIAHGSDINKYFLPIRFRALSSKIIKVKDPQKRNKQLRAIWDLWVENNPSFREVKRVQFFKTRTLSSPELKNVSPYYRKLVYEFDTDFKTDPIY